MADPLPLARFLTGPPLRFVDDLLMSICFMLINVVMVRFGFALMLPLLLCSPRRLGAMGGGG